MRRLIIVQPYVPRYRTAFYRSSAAALTGQGIALSVIVGRQDSARGDGQQDFPARLAPDLLEARTGGRLRFRRIAPVVRGADLLLLEQAIKNLDGYGPLLSQHVGGPSVGFWGHGRSYSSMQSRMAADVKQWMTRRGRWFFAYSPSGARDVLTHGFPAERVTVLNNTIDDEALAGDLAGISDSDVAAFCASQRVDPDNCALFLGGIDALKTVDFLVQSTRHARTLEPRFTLLFGGSGQDESHLRLLQSQGDPIRVLGRLDGRSKALALRAARVLAIPSQLGLVVVDSFVSGVPIATRTARLHGPEAEYLSPDKDSLWLRHDATPQEYGEALVRLLRNERLRASLRARCRAKAQDYRMSSMVDNFVAGVLAWDRSTRSRRTVGG